MHRKETITAYNEFVLNGESYKVGDYVKLKSEAAFKKIDVYLGRIVAAWEDQPDEEDCSYFIRVCWLFTQKEVCPLDTMAKEIVASNMTVCIVFVVFHMADAPAPSMTFLFSSHILFSC